MKKEIHYLILAVVILLSTFACETRLPFDDNGGNGSENSSNGGAVTINAKIENGDPMVGVVRFGDYWSDVPPIVYGKTENGRLIVNLPEIVSESFLFTRYYDRDNEIIAKFARASSIEGKNIEGQWVSFALRPLTSSIKFSAESEWLAEYWYVDRDVNVCYSSDLTFDCSFKKGWNLVYIKYKKIQYEYVIVMYSTQKPSNLTFGWFWI